MKIRWWWWWWWWWWINFVVWLTDEGRSFISSRGHYQRFWPLRISDKPRARFWTCAEPEFRFWWMKLCSSDNHHTTAPQIHSLHKIKLLTFILNLTYNEWDIPYTSNLSIYQRIGKICFRWEKLNYEHIGNSVHTTEFLALGYEYLYQPFDVLPKQTTCEMKALQVYKFTFNNDFF